MLELSVFVGDCGVAAVEERGAGAGAGGLLYHGGLAED